MKIHNHLAKKAFAEIICTCIDITLQKYQPNSNIIINEIDKYKTRILVENIIIKLNMEYSYIIFMLIYLEIIINRVKITREFDIIKYIYVVSASLSLKFIADGSYYLSDICDLLQIDFKQCTYLETLVFKMYHLNMKTKLNWTNRYEHFDLAFQKYLNLFLVEKFSFRRIVKFQKQYKNYFKK